MEDNVLIHQWEYHGGNTQCWRISRDAEGYYTIKSMNSGSTDLYLGINGTSAVLRSDSSIYTKWEIKTSNKGKKLIPKFYENSNFVLALPSSDSYENGTKLILQTFTDDSIYSDEWNILPISNTNRAYSIGGEFHYGEDVINAATNWTECGYNSSSNINPVLGILNGYTLNSSVVYFSTHGKQHRILLKNNFYLADSYFPESEMIYPTAVINAYNLQNAKLYVYDACLTASNTDGSGHNLCTETLAAGAECVIGWVPEIIDSDAFAWQQRFQAKLVEGKSVNEAASYADTFNYINNGTIKNHRIYGNENLVIKLNNPIATASLSFSHDNNQYLKKINCEYTKYNESNLKDIIQHYFDSYIDGNYSAIITYTSDSKNDYIIDYIYELNGFATNAGYSIAVQHNTITYIRDNMSIFNINQSISTTIQANSSIFLDSESIIQKAYQKANSELHQLSSNYTMISQSGEKFYDILTSTYYYRVMSIYQTVSGEYGAFSTLYKIN